MPKSVEKVILLKKCLKFIDFSVGFFKITEPGITEKTDFQRKKNELKKTCSTGGATIKAATKQS